MLTIERLQRLATRTIKDKKRLYYNGRLQRLNLFNIEGFDLKDDCFGGPYAGLQPMSH